MYPVKKWECDIWHGNIRTKNANDHSIWQWQESVHNHGYIIRLVIVHFSPIFYFHLFQRNTSTSETFLSPQADEKIQSTQSPRPASPATPRYSAIRTAHKKRQETWIAKLWALALMQISAALRLGSAKTVGRDSPWRSPSPKKWWVLWLGIQ